MDRTRARELLRRVWGQPTTMTTEEYKELDAVALEEETPLATLLRIGEVTEEPPPAFSAEAYRFFRELPA